MAGKLGLKLAAGAAVLCLIGAGAAVYSSSADTLSDYQKRQQELDSEAAHYQEIIDETASNIAQREEYKQALIDKIVVLDEQINSGRDQIESLDSEIDALQSEIDDAREQIQGRLDKLKQRLRTLYVSGDTTSLEIILGAKDFDEFLDKYELVTFISKSDQKLIDSLKEDIEEINAKKEELKDKKTELTNEQTALDDRLQEMNTLSSENEKLLGDLYEENSGAQDHLDETNEEMKKIDDQIKAYFSDKKKQEETAKKASEARRKIAEQSASSAVSSKAASSKEASSVTASSEAETSSAGTSGEYETSSRETESEYEYEDDSDYEDESFPEESEPESSRAESRSESKPEPEPEPEPSTGGYVWPVPGHYELSSVWNEDRETYNHGAIDISDWDIMNAPVVAAESGVVVLFNDECDHNYAKEGSCGCGGGYGKFIMIDHGNGKATLYAHLSSVAINDGDYVQKGQLIGYVGTTGWSTGPHLHFETRLDGEKYNPMTEYPNI